MDVSVREAMVGRGSFGSCLCSSSSCWALTSSGEGCLALDTCIHAFIHPFIHPSIRLPVRPSTQPSIHSIIHAFILSLSYLYRVNNSPAGMHRHGM
jgi:hypothetical protein